MTQSNSSETAPAADDFASLDTADAPKSTPTPSAAPAAAAVAVDKPAPEPAREPPPKSVQAEPPPKSVQPEPTSKKDAEDTPPKKAPMAALMELLANLGRRIFGAGKIVWGGLSSIGSGLFGALNLIKDSLAPYFKASINAYLALIVTLIICSTLVAVMTYNRTYGEVFKLEEKLAWLNTERETDALEITRLQKLINRQAALSRQNDLVIKEQQDKLAELYEQLAAMSVRQTAPRGAAATANYPRGANDGRKPQQEKPLPPCKISGSSDIKAAVTNCLN